VSNAEPSVVFSQEEKTRIKYHLGYQVLQLAQSISLGVPAATQTSFMVDSVLEHTPVSAAGIVRMLLGRLDAIDARLTEVLGQVRVSQVDSIKLNPTAGDDLERERTRWVNRLANVLGVVPNPYAQDLPGAGRSSMARPVTWS